jgi:alpha-glucosidase
MACISLITVTGIGSCEENMFLNFTMKDVEGCYGFGERTKRLNKVGDSMDFLNIDVAAVFHNSYFRADYNPSYIAIPLAILKIREWFLGLTRGDEYR